MALRRNTADYWRDHECVPADTPWSDTAVSPYNRGIRDAERRGVIRVPHAERGNEVVC